MNYHFTSDSMTEIFSDEIINKVARTVGGFPVGIIEDIVIETETGEMKYLLIKPTSNLISAQKTDSKGRVVVTFNTLKMSGNSVIIA